MDLMIINDLKLIINVISLSHIATPRIQTGTAPFQHKISDPVNKKQPISTHMLITCKLQLQS